VCGGGGHHLWVPKAVLQDRFKDPGRATAFGRCLIATFPLRDDTLYQLSANVQALTETEIGGEGPLALHPSLFSFGDDCSVKPPLDMAISKRLVEEILQDGFMTSTEPILVFQLMDPWPPTAADALKEASASWMVNGPIMPLFVFGQCKGQARILNLLMLLAIIFEDAPGVKVAEVGWGSNSSWLSAICCCIRGPLWVYATVACVFSGCA